MKVKFGILLFSMAIFVLLIFLVYENSYYAWYPDLETYKIYENRTILGSFYGFPKLFLVIFLFGAIMYSFAYIYKRVGEKSKPKVPMRGMYEVTASKEVWDKLPRKYKAQILEYYKKKKEGTR